MVAALGITVFKSQAHVGPWRGKAVLPMHMVWS